MRHDHDSESSGAGVAIAVAVVLLLLAVGGVVVVGGVWLIRSSAQADAMMAMQREALAQEAAARAMAEEAAAARGNEVAGTPRTVTIQIDREGALQLDGEPAPRSDLKTRLDALRSDANSQVEVLIQVDERCAAASILEVVQICEEVGWKNVRLAPLGNPAEASADERSAPTAER
jgi:biopolymer transport protein ExbD